MISMVNKVVNFFIDNTFSTTITINLRSPKTYIQTKHNIIRIKTNQNQYHLFLLLFIFISSSSSIFHFILYVEYKLKLTMYQSHNCLNDDTSYHMICLQCSPSPIFRQKQKKKFSKE